MFKHLIFQPPKQRPAAVALLAMAGALMLTAGLSGAASQSPAGKVRGGFKTAVTAIVEAAYKKDHPPSITIAIARRGVPFYTYSIGYLVLAKKISARPASEYHIGSVSKQFTAAAILRLANPPDHRPPLLSIDDSIAKYFPSLNPRITLREMLTMSSGLKDYLGLPQLDEWVKSGVEPAAVVAAIAPLPLNFPPGSAFQYSNTNYFLLGAIVARVGRKSFGGYLRDNLLLPFGLKETFDGPAPGVPNAAGYSGSDNQPAPVLDPSALRGAGSLSATVLDLVRWDWLLLGGGILSPSVIREMTTPPRVPIFEKKEPSPYAMGLVVQTRFGRREISHTGTIDPGYKATTATFPDTGWSIAIVVNNSSFNIDRLRDGIENAVCRPDSRLRSRC